MVRTVAIYQKEKQLTVWVFQGEPNPTTVARTQSTWKQMVAFIVGITGQVVAVPLEQHRTVNSELYTGICFPELFGKSGKPIAKDESFSTTTMQALIHQLKQERFFRHSKHRFDNI